MSCKPVHKTLKKRKSTGRQAQWEEIRRFPGAFGFRELVSATGQHPDTVRSYLECLLAGGYLAVEGGTLRTGSLSLIKRGGYHAPRLRPDGSLVVQGAVNAAIWDGCRTLGRFTIEEMLEALRLAGQPSTQKTVKSYCNILVQANYLRLVQKGSNRQPSIYQSIRHTGRLAPMIQTSKDLYDPNIKEVVWSQRSEPV